MVFIRTHKWYRLITGVVCGTKIGVVRCIASFSRLWFNTERSSVELRCSEVPCFKMLLWSALKFFGRISKKYFISREEAPSGPGLEASLSFMIPSSASA